MWWVLLIALGLSWLNARIAKAKGYFFWRTFLFTLLLCLVVLAMLHTNGFRLF